MIGEVIQRILKERKIKKTELGVAVYPECDRALALIKASNIVKGKTTRLSEWQVRRICDFLKITPNQLYGYKK